MYDGSKYVMFAKDERGGYKNIYSTTSTSLFGPYSSTTNTVSLVADQDQEGPSAIKIGNNWIVYTDHFSNGIYGALISTDNMATWTDYTDSVSFPAHTRHGNVLTVPISKVNSLIQNEPYSTAEIEFSGNAGSSDYRTDGNWLGGSTPGSNQTAIIQNTQVVNLNSTPSNSPDTLRIGQASSGTLIASSGTLSVTACVQVGNGSVHLDGGAISTPAIYGVIDGAPAIHFNGGTLKAGSSTSLFMAGLNTLDVEAGGAVIDSNGYNVTIPQAMTSASTTGGLTKNGYGTLTLLGANSYSGPTTIAQGTLKLGTNPIAHRWSFNGSLADSVGASNATIVLPGGLNDVSLTSSPGQVTLAGGSGTSPGYVNLGSNLLPDAHTPVSIEVWATQKNFQNWSRIFDLGSSTSENLFMSWTRGTTLTQDRVEWKDKTTNTSDDTNQPYNLSTEYHIVMELNPVGSSTVVTWYSAPSTNANLGSAKGTFTSTNTLGSFVDSVNNLGRSSYSADSTANASYNEVRLWNLALSSTALEVLHDAGPDANLDSLNLGIAGSLPSTTGVNITASGATLDINNLSQTIGSLSGVAGSSVLLGSGTLTIGGNASTTFAGVISGTGGITKDGSGILTLAGNPTYTGNTVITAGVLQLTASAATLAVISGQGQLIVGNGSSATQLTASIINVGTLTIIAGSTVTISPIAGGPLGESSSITAVPEPAAWLLLLIAVAFAYLKRR